MRDILLYLPAKVLPGGFAILTVFFLTNSLAPEEFGLYSYYLALSLLLSVTIFNWLSLGVNRLYLNSDNEVDISLKSTAIYTSLLIFLFTISAVLILYLVKVIDRFYFVVLILAYGFSLLEMLTQWAVIEGKKKEYSVAVIIKPFLLMAFSFAIYVNGAVTAELIIILICFFQFFSCAYTFYSGWKDISCKYFDIQKLKELLSYGLPLSLNFGLMYIVSSSDKLIIKHYFSDAEVGIYAATYDLFSQLVFGLGGVLTLVLYPSALRAFNQSFSAFTEVVRGNFKKAFFYLAGVSIILLILSPLIIKYGLGDPYKKFAWSYFYIVILMTAIYCFYSYSMITVLQLYKKVGLILLSSAIMAITNLSLNFFFMPSLGFEIGIYTTLISYLAGLVVTLFSLRILLRKRDISA